VALSVQKGTMMMWAKPTEEGIWDKGVLATIEGEGAKTWTMSLAYHHMRLECIPWDTYVSAENTSTS